MVTDRTEPPDTLGQRLDRLAKQLMAAHSPAFGWLTAMQELLDHLASLPGPTADRFDRVEAGGAAIDFGYRMIPAHKAVADDGGPGADGRLPSDIHAQLRRVIGRDTAAMRVHDDRAADLLARQHRADAVTVGRDVYFRQGRLRPRDPQGFGLIAHEATHVAELLAPTTAWRRLTGGARPDEERLAQANERRASHDSRGHAQTVSAPPQRLVRPQHDLVGAATPPAAPYAPSAVSTPDQAALQPMRAAEDRTAEPSPSLDLEALQRSLLQELKRQLLTEFERGA